MKNKAFQKPETENRWNLQLFADGGDGGEGTEPEGGEGTEPEGGEETKEGNTDDNEDDNKKYSDADLDRILEKKFARWQKQQAKKVSEAEKLAARNASQKSEDRIKDLEDKLNKYEQEQAHTQMMTQARGILREQNISISDKLLGSLVTDEADSTEENINEFVNLFRSEVSKAVKEQLKGAAPKKGSNAGKLTKEEIMKVKNPIERQKLIRENMELFR